MMASLSAKNSKHSVVPFASQKKEWLIHEGSLSAAEIDRWQNSLCGLLCAQMVLNAVLGRLVPLAELLVVVVNQHVYDEKRGWIHEKIVQTLQKFGVNGQRIHIHEIKELFNLINEGELVIASVSPRYLEKAPRLSLFPRKRNGHLVLVVGMTEILPGKYQLIVHDPGSEISEGGPSLVVDSDQFQKCFSGNCMVFRSYSYPPSYLFQHLLK